MLPWEMLGLPKMRLRLQNSITSAKQELRRITLNFGTPKIWFFLLAILSTLRALIPFMEDQKVFFAAAHQTQISGAPFPLGSYQQWEMKPWPARVLYFCLYRVFSFLYADKALFIFAVQLTALVFAWLAIFLLATTLHKKAEQRFIMFSILAIILVGPDSLLQVEYLALIISLFAIFFLVRTNRKLNFFGELLLVLVTCLKGSTIFFSILVVITVAQYNNESFREHFIKYLRISMANALAILLIWSELLDRAVLQGVGDSSLKSILVPSKLLEFVFGLKGAIIDFPFIIFIPLLTLLLVTRRNRLNFIFFGTLTTVLFLYSLFLQKFFNYHYLYLLFFSICGVFLLCKDRLNFSTHEKAFGLTSGIAVFFIVIEFWTTINVLGSTISSSNASFSKIELSANYFGRERIVSERLSHTLGNDKVLFLTDGVINFYLDNTSNCKEFYPIHFQRANQVENGRFIMQSEWYKDFIKCATEFRGKHILVQSSWMPSNEISTIILDKYLWVEAIQSGYRYYDLYEIRN